VPSSSPLLALITIASGSIHAAARPSTSRAPWLGVTPTTNCLPFTAAGRSLVTATSGGSVCPGKYGQSRVACISAAVSALRAHMLTRCPALPNSMARQLP
jgi:hypothetical protein